MKKIDPTERALDAYLALDTDQRATLMSLIRYCERLQEQIGRSASGPAPIPTPKRGRPPGSKNRKQAETEQVELVEKLFGNNAAGAEGL